MRLSDKVALVTGSSRGIGSAIAKGLAKEGAKVVINYVKNEDRARQTLEEIKCLGGEAIIVQADISKENDVLHLVEEANRAFGKIDILVSNAAASLTNNPFLDTEWEEVLKEMEVSVKGPFLVYQAVVPGMIERKWGRLINIGSGHYFAPQRIHYGYWISKAGALTLAKNLARELAPYGITVNSVLPGVIDTEILKRTEEMLKSVFQRQAIQRVGKTEDVVGTVVYFASDESSFVTGEVLNVTGGLLYPP